MSYLPGMSTCASRRSQNWSIAYQRDFLTMPLTWSPDYWYVWCKHIASTAVKMAIGRSKVHCKSYSVTGVCFPSCSCRFWTPLRGWVALKWEGMTLSGHTSSLTVRATNAQCYTCVHRYSSIGHCSPMLVATGLMAKLGVPLADLLCILVSGGGIIFTFFHECLLMVKC